MRDDSLRYTVYVAARGHAHLQYALKLPDDRMNIGWNLSKLLL